MPQMLWADSTFLDLFDLNWSKAIRKTILRDPNSVVLTEESAAKFLRKRRPDWKTLVRYDSDTISFKVTGILEIRQKTRTCSSTGYSHSIRLLKPMP
jgi:putative ABC transport system permease protein